MGVQAQKILGAILFALIVTVGINMVGNLAIPIPKAGPGGEAGKAQPKPANPSQAAVAPPAEVDIAQRLAKADPKRGAGAAKVCEACHNFQAGQPNKMGPNLNGVAGRPIASLPGFAYSDALKGKGGTWTDQALDQWLTRPSAFAPGTRMAFPGVANPYQRADIIAYLHSLSAR